ncbi:hypothetical protein A6F58_00535 [Prescottella equi]|nr:hypothetical protein A6F58_00535 [Prescottella equi]
MTNTVYLCRSLTQRERRATLTHELMHVVRGVVPRDLAWLEEKEDRVVDRLAARQLIDIEEFIDALCWAGHSTNDECAEELWVDLDMLEVWVDSLSETEIEYIRSEVDRRK